MANTLTEPRPRGKRKKKPLTHSCHSPTLSTLRRSFPEADIGTGTQHFDTAEVCCADKADLATFSINGRFL